MIPYIIMVVSFLFDGILTNFLPYLPNQLSYFTPLLTLVSILLIHPFYRKRQKEFYITIFILGILYDLFYTNLLFFNGVLFLGAGFLQNQVEKSLPQNGIYLAIESIGVIFAYELVTGILLFTFNMVPVTVLKILYKATHSLLLNVIYVEITYGILKWIPKKYKKISIN